MSKTIDIVVPDLGDFDKVEVIDVLVGAGDTVEREDGLVTIETDKASMDIPAPGQGVVEKLTIGVGDTVSTGDVIGQLTIGDGDAAAGFAAPTVGGPSGPNEPVGGPSGPNESAAAFAAKAAPTAAPTVGGPSGPNESVGGPSGPNESVGGPSGPNESAAAFAAEAAPTAAPTAAPAIDEAGFAKAHASPSVRKLARELGVDLARVKGTGLKARVLHDDVKAFVKAILTGRADGPAGAGLPKTPVVDFAKFGEIDIRPLTRIQKISGPRLQASWINLPHVTQHDLADITGLEAKRRQLKGPAKERGISLTPLAFVMKACVTALQEFPQVNSSLTEDGKNLVFRKY
ncbi:MAG: 2-oxo acid dehydrogenase subunit E2, partial [Proteobacteria bacterium]|nr:2-oxo acid dehydrogenase subunit E2 [Pseudomonadota bacterium]